MEDLRVACISHLDSMLFNDLTENAERSRDRGGTYKWPLWNLGRSSRV